MLNTYVVARDSRKVEAQKLRPAVPAHCFGGVMISRENSRWVFSAGNAVGGLSRGESFEGLIP
jgi:hypothetical protein